MLTAVVRAAVVRAPAVRAPAVSPKLKLAWR
jgi:hypothetical protein